jgi:hypothetical protein
MQVVDCSVANNLVDGDATPLARYRSLLDVPLPDVVTFWANSYLCPTLLLRIGSTSIDKRVIDQQAIIWECKCTKRAACPSVINFNLMSCREERRSTTSRGR